MKVIFWLLDVNSETKGNKTEIWLWGIDSHEKRVLVIDRTYVGYFYLVIEEGRDPSEITEKISKAPGLSVVKTEVVARRFFGKPVEAIKVYSKQVIQDAKQLRSLEGVKEILEDDIRPSMRYLVDNSVVPCSWIEAEVEGEIGSDISARVDRVFVAKAPPKAVGKQDSPSLRVLSFSMICYSREGSPKPNRNPVVVISIMTNKNVEKQFVAAEDKDDKPILEQFIKYVHTVDPDIIVGYGTNTLDWSYLCERCRNLEMKLNLDRVCAEPHTSVYGHVSLTGIASLDLEDFTDQFPNVKVKTLENLSDHLGISKRDQQTIIEDVNFADFWDDKQKRTQLVTFSLERARKIQCMTGALLDLAVQLSSLVGLPLDHVMTAAVGFRVEWFMINRAQRMGELVPKRVEQPYRPYAGGLVLEPQPGLHENIAVLDFKSMYPSIMIAYNLSPDTYVAPKEKMPTGGVFEAPEVEHRFRKEPPGFNKEILSYLIRSRAEIREHMKSLNKNSVEYRVLDARQKAVKIITNATYGYAGWVGARWYNKPVAEAASAWGRHMILSAKKMTEKAGLKVIYGDTDSLFITNDPEKTGELEKTIERELGLEVELDKIYIRVFFTEARKRYAGLLPDGKIEIVGLEGVRGDWAEIAKKVQEQVLEIVLKDKSPEKAADYVHKTIKEMRQRKVPFKDLVIWKTLTKSPEEYEVNAPHVEAAKMLAAKGWRMSVGDKVGYVVLAGEGRLYGRVKPHVFAKPGEIDMEYYVSKQVVPAAARILENWGMTEEKLLGTEETKKQTKGLMDFTQSED